MVFQFNNAYWLCEIYCCSFLLSYYCLYVAIALYICLLNNNISNWTLAIREENQTLNKIHTMDEKTLLPTVITDINNTGLCKSPVKFRFSYSNHAGYVILGRIKQVWLHNDLLVYKASYHSMWPPLAAMTRFNRGRKLLQSFFMDAHARFT